MKIKNIPVDLIDVADENVRKNFSFGKDSSDQLMKEHLAKFELLQPVVYDLTILLKDISYLSEGEDFWPFTIKERKKFQQLLQN
ncbi:MAG: hypothetical protein P0116_07760 [Candidatus Nitrosocosmicus sp.]|nr:hypothetical protein [Candidatus Nitrosocosmicus sp.]